MRGEWIEIDRDVYFRLGAESLPMRGEWIEILISPLSHNCLWVSPHAGRVD